MRKKLTSMMLVVGMANVMVGCASSVNLTDKQSDLVADYLTSVIVRYDRNENNNKLVKLEEEVEATATPAPTVAPTSTPTMAEDESTTKGDATGTPTGTNKDTTNDKSNEIEKMTKVTLESLYDLKNVSITYKNVKEYNKYPNSGSVDTITPSKNHKFLAVTFAIKNKDSKDVSLDLLKSQVSFLLKANGSEWIPSVHTLLDNDMTYYQGKVKAGESKEVVVLFEVKDSFKLSNATFYATSSKMKAYEVTIK